MELKIEGDDTQEKKEKWKEEQSEDKTWGRRD